MRLTTGPGLAPRERDRRSTDESRPPVAAVPDVEVPREIRPHTSPSDVSVSMTSGRRAAYPARTLERASDLGGAWILVLIRDEPCRARVEKTMRSHIRVIAVASIRAAEETLTRASSRPTAAVVSATDAEGRNCLPLVRTLTQLRPTVPVIGYCTVDRAASRDVLTLVRAGVHEVIFRDIDDPARAIRRFVDTAATSSGVDDILRAITPDLSETLLPFVRYCLEHPRITSVAAVADALGIHRKTLFIHCRGASAVPPGIIMTWCRLLLAAHLLATSLRTVEAVARDLGFASATALRNITKRYAGLRPTAFRDGSAMSSMTRAFLAATSRATATREVVSHVTTHVEAAQHE